MGLLLKHKLCTKNPPRILLVVNNPNSTLLCQSWHRCVLFFVFTYLPYLPIRGLSQNVRVLYFLSVFHGEYHIPILLNCHIIHQRMPAVLRIRTSQQIPTMRRRIVFLSKNNSSVQNFTEMTSKQVAFLIIAGI